METTTTNNNTHINYKSQLLNISNVNLFIHIWENSDIKRIEPKGIVYFLHGMAEHSLRFREFGEFLVSNGFIFFSNDHRGHGKSVVNEGELGHISEKDCLNVLCNDSIQVYHYMNRIYKEELGEEIFSKIPKFIIGYSLGSFISSLILYTEPTICENFIHLGTNCGTNWLSNLSVQIIRFERWRLGSRGISTMLDDISSKELNKEFHKTKSKENSTFDYYTRDKNEIDIYLKDPLCGKDFDNQFWLDMMITYNKIISNESKKSVIPKHCKFLILSGELDPIGYNGNGPKLFYNHLKKHNIENVQLKLYKEARHDLLHELNRLEVFNDILKFCIGDMNII